MPLRVNASAVANVKPARSRVPFAETTVPAPVVPRGVFVALPAAPNFNVPAEIVVRPVYELAPDKVNVPAPAFVTAKAVEPFSITPVIELAPVFVTLNVPVDLIAAAFNISVVIVSPVREVPPPTAFSNVTSPVDPLLVIVKVLAPLTVELNKIVPLGAVNVGLVVNVTAPV